MASNETIRTVHVMNPPDDDGDSDYYDAGRRMSRLSIESSDGDEADAEPSDDEKDAKGSLVDDSDSDKGAGFTTSLPGTPDRFGRPVLVKEYASETEARVRVKRKKGSGWGWRMRERWLDRVWAMKKSKAVEGECRLLVRPRGPDSGCICMDMEEVKACRDLGLELPCDWTVEIPCVFSGVDTSSGGNSPISNWRISSPGDDPKDVKARLRVWAQAVALASASSLGG